MNERLQLLIDQLVIAFRQPSTNPRMATLLFGTTGLLLLLVIALLAIMLVPRQRKITKRITYFIPEGEEDEGAQVTDGEAEDAAPTEGSAQATGAASSTAVSAQVAVPDDSAEEPTEKDTAEEPGEPRPTSRWRRILGWTLGTGLPIILMFVAIGFAYVYTGTNSYCVKSCHGVDEHVRVAVQRDHADCVECHEDPAPVGIPANVGDRGRMIWNRLTGQRTPTLAHDAKARTGVDGIVDASSCLSCHRSVLKRTIESKVAKVRISHIEPYEAGMQCADCHETTGHEPVGERAAISMRRCIVCHDDKIADAACETCHLGDITLAGREREILSEAEKLKGSGKHQYPAVNVTNTDCGGCHGAQKECDACHGLRMPHPYKFLDGYHAKAAAFEKKELCWRCHGPNDCESGNCHLSFTNSHLEPWKEIHQTYPWDSGCGCHMRDRNEDVPICVFCHDNAPVKKIEIPDASRGLFDPERND